LQDGWGGRPIVSSTKHGRFATFAERPRHLSKGHRSVDHHLPDATNAAPSFGVHLGPSGTLWGFLRDFDLVFTGIRRLISASSTWRPFLKVHFCAGKRLVIGMKKPDNALYAQFRQPGTQVVTGSATPTELIATMSVADRHVIPGDFINAQQY